MISIIIILVLLACVVLGFFILVQNPKGGGLAGSFGTLGSQVMGVKQSSDVMEKGTWTLIGIIGALCMVSVMFLQKPGGSSSDSGKAKQNTSAPAKKGK